VERSPVCPPSPATSQLPGVSVRAAPAGRVGGTSAIVPAASQTTPTALATSGDASPSGPSALAVPTTEAMVAEAHKLQHELTALAEVASPGNRAYLERLGRAAAEAAAKGYGVKRMTHTVRRTRVRKTTNTTDMRTMETETNTEEQSTVDSWMEEGSPTVSGVGVFCARGSRVFDRYSDGSEVVQDAQVKGGSMFWLGGDATSVQTFTFNHSFAGSCRGDSQARCARSTPPMRRMLAA